MSFPTIPVLNISDLKTNSNRFVEQLTVACSEIGFFSITNHNVDPLLIEKMRYVSSAFFSLSLADKESLIITPSNYRGYIPLGFFTPNESGKPADQYEAYKLHTEVSSQHSICTECELYGENRWPKHPSDFQATVIDYWAAMDQLSNQLLKAFSLALSLAEDELQTLFDLPLTNMTLLHYPPMWADQLGSGIHPHTDSDAFTILYPDAAGGLKIRQRDGSWLDALTADGDFLVNVGDMMEIWSGGRFISTPHQVIKPIGKDRISFPYFAVPRYDCIIKPLVKPLIDFDRPDVSVGKWQAEDWRTNWTNQLPEDPIYNLGTIKT